MKTSFLTLAAITCVTLPASAVIIGTETFDTDGFIAGQTGGTGFNYDLFDNAVTSTTSNWNNTGGTPSVIGGSLITNGTSALREYNGNIEGVGDPANDGQDDHERSGALRGTGTVFYSFDITRTSSAVWSGASSFDFGAERIFFGVSGTFAATDEASIEISGVGGATSGISLIDGQTYTLVAALDFDNDLLGLYVNPDSTDEWTNTGGTADVTLAYTNTNWSTSVRLGSGGEVAWDNLIVATTPEEVGLLGLDTDENMIRITSIEIEEGTGDIILTWTSTLGRVYRVETSTDLINNADGSWYELEDSYPAGGATGDSTTFRIPANSKVLIDTNRLFVRVMEIPILMAPRQ